MKNRIQRFAKFFRAIFLIALIVSPLFVGSIWLSGGEILVSGEEDPSMAIEILTDDLAIDEAHSPDFPLPWSTRLLGLGVAMIPTGIGMLSLWWLFRLFSCFPQVKSLHEIRSNIFAAQGGPFSLAQESRRYTKLDDNRINHPQSAGRTTGRNYI